MQVVHFRDARRLRSSRQVTLRLDLENESSIISEGKLAKGDSNGSSGDSHADVARHFTRMNEAHDRIRGEILGANQTKPKRFPNGHKTTRATRSR